MNRCRVASTLLTVVHVNEDTVDVVEVVDVVVATTDVRKVQKRKIEVEARVNTTPNPRRNPEDKAVDTTEEVAEVVDVVVVDAEGTAVVSDHPARDLETSLEQTVMTTMKGTATRDETEVVGEEVIPEDVQEDTDVAQDVPQHRVQEMREVITATTTTVVTKTTSDGMTVVVIEATVVVIEVIAMVVIVVVIEVIVKVVIVMVEDHAEEDTVATERLSKVKKVTQADPTMVVFVRSPTKWTTSRSKLDQRPTTNTNPKLSSPIHS